MKQQEEKAQLLFSEKTPAGDFEVWQNKTVRYLYIDNKVAIQSKIDMAHKEKLLLQHSRAMMSFLLFKPKPKSLILLGLGGGGIIHFLSHWFPELNITAVDNNNSSISIAKDFFSVSNTPHIHIKQADAFEFLTKEKVKNTDVILVDIHDGTSIPDFLYDSDFIAQCFDTLSNSGILVINLLVNTDHAFLRIMTALRQHFTDISLCIEMKDQQNIVVLAFKALKTFNKEQIISKAKLGKKKYNIEFEEFMDSAVIVDVKLDV